MDKDVKAKWLVALRSGKYAQGRGRLRNPDNSFCCLGVLCDIIDPEGWEAGGMETPTFWHGERHETPNVTCRLIGLISGHEVTVIEMNDSGADFAEIADYIEENL